MITFFLLHYLFLRFFLCFLRFTYEIIVFYEINCFLNNEFKDLTDVRSYSSNLKYTTCIIFDFKFDSRFACLL